MARLQFSFLNDNLLATADYLAGSPHFPTAKRTALQIRERLKEAAIKSFKTKYGKVQNQKATPLDSSDIEIDFVEAPVLWRGIGALFCPVPSVAVDGTVTVTADMPFPVGEKYIVGVNFLVVLR